MGENCGTWVPELHFDWQSPTLNSFGAPLDVGKQYGTSAAMNMGANMVTQNETMPAYVSSALPRPQLGHSHGWFYCLPRFRQEFTMPPPNFTPEEKHPDGNVEGSREEFVQNGASSFPQKQFLVIDQTGDQTTLVYSSRFGGPVECPASWDSKLHGSNNLNNWNELPSLGRDVNQLVGLGPTLDVKVDDNQETDDTESVMHEDTEEINALLYSDSDGYSTEEDDDDDEVTSTGHSPSTMTTHDNQEEEPDRGIAEEVASSVRKTKKRKLLDEAYVDNDDMQFMDTASSLNGNNRPFEVGDDAESRCSSGGNYSQGSGEMGSLSGHKKMRKEKIQDILSVLQCIVPDGKDKDPIELLDKAIHCLRSLKLKARELGLNAL